MQMIFLPIFASLYKPAVAEKCLYTSFTWTFSVHQQELYALFWPKTN